MINVLIAIQARSNSTRFPRKIYEHIGRKRVLDHVIDRAKSAAQHVTRFPTNRDLKAHVAILHPETDHELVKTFLSSDCHFIGGPEHDVLARYIKAQEITQADYIVRLTSDCPLLLDFVIVKHINSATFKSLDYVSNVEESCRSAADGFDCEVMSAKAIAWLKENAIDPEDREHVTSMIRRVRPKELAQGFVSFKYDSSSEKMSLDTPEDLERIKRYYHQREHKLAHAERLFGKGNVFEL